MDREWGWGAEHARQRSWDPAWRWCGPARGGGSAATPERTQPASVSQASHARPRARGRPPAGARTRRRAGQHAAARRRGLGDAAVVDAVDDRVAALHLLGLGRATDEWVRDEAAVAAPSEPRGVQLRACAGPWRAGAWRARRRARAWPSLELSVLTAEFMTLWRRPRPPARADGGVWGAFRTATRLVGARTSSSRVAAAAAAPHLARRGPARSEPPG
jgi:hypothetical protein